MVHLFTVNCMPPRLTTFKLCLFVLLHFSSDRGGHNIWELKYSYQEQ